MEPRIVGMDKQYITGIFGDIKSAGLLLKTFFEMYDKSQFAKADEYRCELPFWGKRAPKGIRKKGENYFIGYKTAGVLNQGEFVTIELPACQWAVFEVNPAKWYKSGDKEVEKWVRGNEQYRLLTFEGSIFQLEYYNREYISPDPALEKERPHVKYTGDDSILEVWYPLEDMFNYENKKKKIFQNME
jgi:predicted transcriptional regulator YdeE